MVAWRKEGLAFGHFAINAAPADFRRSVLADRVIEKLEQAGIPARELQLEVTEGVFLGRGAENAESTIRQLHDYGVNIALDDFGTGFASLSHLRQRSEEHTSELQSLMRTSYAVFCLQKKKKNTTKAQHQTHDTDHKKI